jgi:uncharacterized membrane protein
MEVYAHSLFIQKVRYDEIVAGETTDIAITILNNGEEDEVDVNLEVEIPELNYLKKIRLLNPLTYGNEYTAYMALDIPDAGEGIYTLNIRAYNDEASADYEKDLIMEPARQIAGAKKVKISINDFIPGFFKQEQDGTQTVVAGKPSVFSMSVQNNQKATKTYEFALSEINWAESVRLDPRRVTLESGESMTVNIHLIPDEDAGETSKTFILQILEDGELVSTSRINVDVTQGFGPINSNLSYVFAGLILVLAVLAAGWSWKQTNGNKTGKKVEKVYY